MITLAENSYGKSRVRLAKVKRHPGHHDFREWTIEILLQGDFDSCFVAGDNSKILPTDTMKNTVYSLARTSSAECMEEFGKELVAFFLDRNPQVSAARVYALGKIMAASPHRRKTSSHHICAIRRRVPDGVDCGCAKRRAVRPGGARKSGYPENGRLGIRGFHQGFAHYSAGNNGPSARYISSACDGTICLPIFPSYLCVPKFATLCSTSSPRT